MINQPPRPTCGSTHSLFIALWVGCAVSAGSFPAEVAPYAATQSAFLVTGSAAVLGGMAVPNGLTATAWFQWGTNSGYQQQTPPTDLGAGTDVIRVTAPIQGLSSNTVYSFQLVLKQAC